MRTRAGQNTLETETEHHRVTKKSVCIGEGFMVVSASGAHPDQPA
jgi:hypothetical protein